MAKRAISGAVTWGLLGGVVAAASAAGARTGGRSPFFGTVLLGFGLHGAVHLAQSAAYRGYTPGVVNAPLVVVPYSVWALRRLAAAGVPMAGGRSAAAGLALFPVAAAGVHALARRLNRRREGGPGAQKSARVRSSSRATESWA